MNAAFHKRIQLGAVAFALAGAAFLGLGTPANAMPDEWRACTQCEWMAADDYVSAYCELTDGDDQIPCGMATTCMVNDTTSEWVVNGYCYDAYPFECWQMQGGC